jgi:hypothetical protein
MFEPWIKNLPARVLTLLKKSLEIQPREYVFVEKDGSPYKTPEAWIDYHNGRFSEWFGIGSTVVMMRYARCTVLKAAGNGLSVGDRMKISDDMGMDNFLRLYEYADNDDVKYGIQQDGTYETVQYVKEDDEFHHFKGVRIS